MFLKYFLLGMKFSVYVYRPTSNGLLVCQKYSLVSCQLLGLFTYCSWRVVFHVKSTFRPIAYITLDCSCFYLDGRVMHVNVAGLFACAAAWKRTTPKHSNGYF